MDSMAEMVDSGKADFLGVDSVAGDLVGVLEVDSVKGDLVADLEVDSVEVGSVE